MTRIISYFLFSLVVLSGCNYPVKSEMKYDVIKNSSYITSKPIYFFIEDKKSSRSQAYFTLYYSFNSNKYFLKLNWLLFASTRPYIMLKDSLKLSLDDRLELLLSPVKSPKVTKISFEPAGVEEEAVFVIDRPTLEIISQAGKVDIIVYSRTQKLKGYFIHKHSFNAFGEFLNKVDLEFANE
jgi:hypothetical protein